MQRENILSYGKIFIPFLVSVIFILLEHIAFGFDILNIRPMLGLICVFFWLFNRSDVFNILTVFCLGLISDALNNTPVGACLLAYMLMYVLENKIAKYISNKLFVVSFASFGILSLVVVVIQWLLLCCYYRQLMPFSGIFLSWLITVDLYPLVAMINLKIMSGVSNEEI